MVDKILVVKNTDKIIISCDGKKLLINSSHKLFDELKDLDKKQIKEWYSNELLVKGGEYNEQ